MSTWKRKIWLGTFLVAAMAFSAACTGVPASAPVSGRDVAAPAAVAVVSSVIVDPPQSMRIVARHCGLG